MTTGSLMENLASTTSRRLDLLAYGGAFLVGLCMYFALHVGLRLHQLIVTTAIVLVMGGYALVATKIPLLRLRLDQAGDNVYYLGLLFTLTSMAFALYEFGAATSGAEGSEPTRSGAQQIIANFGIALGSTIAGIFLRVVLHQMRIDPADVESTSRIELAEASKKIRARLEDVSSDLGRFHGEISQRATDAVQVLMLDAGKAVTALGSDLGRVTKEMLEATGSAQEGVLERARGLTRMLEETATEAQGAIERLRAVEPPPLTLSRRLEKIGKVLQAAGDQTERLVANLEHTANSADQVVGRLSGAATAIIGVTEQIPAGHAVAAEQMAASIARFATGLDAVCEQLGRHRELLGQIEEQANRTNAESQRAQSATVEVLNRLTEITRGITVVLTQANPRSDGGGTE